MATNITSIHELADSIVENSVPVCESCDTITPTVNEICDLTCQDVVETGTEENRNTTHTLSDKQEPVSARSSDDEINEIKPIKEDILTVNESEEKHFEKESNKTEHESVDGPDGISKFLKSLLCGPVKQKTVDEDERPYERIKTQTEETNLQTDGVYKKSSENLHRTVPAQNYGVQPPKLDLENCYSFNHPVRGYMVIIVNESFKYQTTRMGSGRDWQYLDKLARKIGFIVYNRNQTKNVSRSQTLQILREMSSADHSGCDMFMFAISTHGLMQPNPRAKGKQDHALICADDKMIFTSSITEMFNDENCPSLKNKPKVFVIQACRGEGFDSGSDIAVLCPSVQVYKTRGKFPGDTQCAGDCIQQPNDDSDAKGHADSTVTTASPRVFTGTHTGRGTSARVVRAPRKAEPTQKPYHVVDTPSLRCDNDQLVLYAIPQGQMAWRNESDGSWMLYYLHKVINGRDSMHPLNLLKVLTKVSAHMSKRATKSPSNLKLHEKKAIPIIEHKLTRDIILTPKHYHTQYQNIANYRYIAL